MDFLMLCLLPCAAILITYIKSRYEKKQQSQMYNEIVAKAAEDIMKAIRSLPGEK